LSGRTKIAFSIIDTKEHLNEFRYSLEFQGIPVN